MNLLVAYLLFIDVGPRYLGSLPDTIASAAGVLLAGLFLARIFSGERLA
jgi:hypothetical protein